MMPRDEDYVIKDGKRHPNLSKSKNRIQSTVETIKAAFLDWKYDMSHTGEVIL